MLPTVNGTCPTLTNGTNTLTVNGAVNSWTLWMGANKPSGAGGPIVLYWFSGGSGNSTSQEALTALGAGVVQEIQDMGGIVAAPDGPSGVGPLVGAAWRSGDVAFADQLVACAIQQRHIDTQHIHAVGTYIGGGLATYMWYVRSGYVASVVTYLGGLMPLPTDLQDPSHSPAALLGHGDLIRSGTTAYPISSWRADLLMRHAFFVDCDDGATMPSIDFSIAPQAWQFMKDHPFGVSPEPYTKLSSPWPTYCTVM